MTREEAIRIFRKEIECMSHTKCSDCILEKVCDPISTTPLDSEYIEAFGMAINALSAEPCEDAISRAWIKEAIHNLYQYSRHTPTEEDIQEYIVDDAPSVTPKQKMGRWENGHCSECGCDVPAYIIDWKWQKDMDAKYCPMCGAKMSENPTGSNCTACEDTETWNGIHAHITAPKGIFKKIWGEAESEDTE